MISKPTNARKCMKVYYTLLVPPTCFDQSYSHLHGGLLQRIRYVELLQKFLKQYTSLKYFIFNIFYILHLFYKCTSVQKFL